MNRIYVSGYYLKTLHYLFFSFAVFTLTVGMIFFASAFIESLSFLGLSAFYCASSLYVAYRFYKNYREILEPFRLVRIYLLPYLSLVAVTIIPVTILVLVFPSISALIYSFLFINYYMFFIISIGFLVGRLKIISRFFDVYDIFILDRARRIAKRYAIFDDVGRYKIGTDQRIDEILDEILAHKDFPLPYVRKLERTICEIHVISINRMLGKIREGREKTVMESLEKMKKEYLEKIMEIEQKTD